MLVSPIFLNISIGLLEIDGGVDIVAFSTSEEELVEKSVLSFVIIDTCLETWSA